MHKLLVVAQAALLVQLALKALLDLQALKV
jgi:hypothetical protein